MLSKFAAAAFVVSQATSVLAHGGVTAYTIGGVKYPGWEPYIGQASQSTAGRTYPSYDPILSATASTMACNNSGGTGNPNQKSLTIAAGQAITAHWPQWTHMEGPVTVYLAKCPGSTCDGFSSTGAKWFKIHQSGLISGTVGAGKWGNGEVLSTLKWTTTIPSCLAAGAYLIRHELLALHQANTPQFYPECAQLLITGGGGVTPSSTVSIPGAWSASDPGVNINIYADPAKSWTSYPVPGPAVWTCSGGGGTSQPPVTTTTRPVTTTTTTTTPTTPTTSSGGGGTVPRYGQCGGNGYTGPTVCVSPYTCIKSNEFYSQCL